MRDSQRATRGRDDDDRPARRGRDDDERPSRRGRDDDDRPSSRRGRDDDDRGGRSGGSRYEYTSRSADQARKRSNQGGGDFDKYLVDAIKMWKPNDGANTIRILPPTWNKPEHFGYDIYVHYGVGPDRQSYLCPSKMKGEPCPICEERAEAERAGDEKYAKDLKPRQRVLVYVVDRDHEKEGVQAWASPWTFDRDLAKVSTDRKSGAVLAIDHPEEGYDVEFDKKGAKDRTEYLGIAVARRDSPIGDDKWLDFAMDHPLPDQLQFFDYDHIKRAFGGGGAPAKARDDDDDRPVKRARDDDRPARRDRDDDEDRGGRREDGMRVGRRGAPAEDGLTWQSVHDMTSSELDDLVELHDLAVNPSKFDSDEELADAICEKMSLDKPRPRRSHDDDDRPARRGRDEDEDDSERLARMRRGRDDDDRPARRRVD